MANNGTVINVSSACCIVISHKGAITEVILIYDLNARDFSMEMPNSLGILHTDANFSREFCMEMPTSLGNFA